MPRANGEAALERLQDACAGLGIVIAYDGTIDEPSAAQLLNRSPSTLKNWRFAERPLLFERSGSRIRYQLSELARFVAAGQDVGE